MIIVATVSPDFVYPCYRQYCSRQNGAPQAWGFDLEAACSGFLYALQTGAQLSIQVCTKRWLSSVLI